MIEIFVFVLILSSLAASFLAAVTRETEKLLWGTVLCSVGLGLAVLLSGGSYFGILVLSTFLITDLLIYLYFRSISVQPRKKIQHKSMDRLNRIFMLWIGLCSFGLAALTLHNFMERNALSEERLSAISILHQRIWGDDWYLLLLTTLMVALLALGGFFLVRREKQ